MTRSIVSAATKDVVLKAFTPAALGKMAKVRHFETITRLNNTPLLIAILLRNTIRDMRAIACHPCCDHELTPSRCPNPSIVRVCVRLQERLIYDVEERTGDTANWRPTDTRLRRSGLQ